MAGTLLIRNLHLGEGLPKICVPLVDEREESLLWGAVLAKATAADLVEWRADLFGPDATAEEILRMATTLRAAMGDTPLLFTYRTRPEGGQGKIEKWRYLELNREIAARALADLVDIELSGGEEAVAAFVEGTAGFAAKVLVSSHDFAATPTKEAMVNRLHRMRKLGADIPKLAVMPGSFTDVLSLLGATEEFSRTADCPVVTMAMGELGKISRIAGAFTGSAFTFGALEDKASAPGQLPVQELRTILKALGGGEC